MNKNQRIYDRCNGWLIQALSLPNKIHSSIYENFFKINENDEELPVKRWIGTTHINPGSYGFFPTIPNMQFPLIVKAFVVTYDDNTQLDHLPSPSELGFMTMIGTDGVYCTISNQMEYAGAVKFVFLPDLRDLERIIFGESGSDYLVGIERLPLANQLKQELNEANLCKRHNLPIATIATLSIAMETACKVVLEKREVSYSPIRDGLNDLLNILVKNRLLSEKDRQACLALKGLRNAVDHGHSGIVSQQNAELFYTSGEALIKVILQGTSRNGTS